VRPALRLEPLALPTGTTADEPDAIVQPVGPALPELDRIERQPVAAPERRAGDVAVGVGLLDLRILAFQAVATVDRLGLV